MSRGTQELQGRYVSREQSLEEAQMQAQAADIHTIQRAKELLCDLWKQGRVKIEVWTEGGAALSAALHAVEDPSIKSASLALGASLSNEQWLKEQRSKNEPF